MFRNWFSLILAVTTLIFAGNNPVDCRIEVSSSESIQHKGDEVIMKAGGNLTLTCVGDTPLKWEYPRYEKIESKSVIEITEEKRDDKYFSILSLKNAYYYDTEFFGCHPADNIDNIDLIYIFVEDETNLLNINKKLFWNFVFVTENKSFTVPCKPTSPNVKVRLESDKGENVIPGKMFKGHAIEYSPRTGFHFRNINSTTPRLSYVVCHGEYNGKNDSATFSVKIEEPYIENPFLTNISPSKLAVGSTLTLNCSVRVGLNESARFEWILPKEKENHVTITRLPPQIWIYRIVEHLHARRKLEQSTLTINNITLEDVGIYTCIVRNNDDAYNYGIAYVNFH